MSDIRPPREPESAPEPQPAALGVRGESAPRRRTAAASARLLPRRQNPWLVVEVDGSADVPRRPGLGPARGRPPRGDGRRRQRPRRAGRRSARRARRASSSARSWPRTTGSRRRCSAPSPRPASTGRTRTAVLERPVFDALIAADPRRRPRRSSAPGARRLLRQAVPRPPTPPRSPAAPDRPATGRPTPRPLPARPGLLPSGRAPARPPGPAAPRRPHRRGVAPVLAAAVLRGRRPAASSRRRCTTSCRPRSATWTPTYGAMGVLTPDGRRLDRFVIVGHGRGGPRAHRPAAGREGASSGCSSPSRGRSGSTTSAEHPAFGGFPRRASADAVVPRRPGPRRATPSSATSTSPRSAPAGRSPRPTSRSPRRWPPSPGWRSRTPAWLERAEARRRVGAGRPPRWPPRCCPAPIPTRCSARWPPGSPRSPRRHGRRSWPRAVDDDETLTIVAAVGQAAADVEGVRIALGTGTYLGASRTEAGVPRLIEDISTMPIARPARPRSPSSSPRGVRPGDARRRWAARPAAACWRCMRRQRTRAVRPATSSTCSSAFAAQASVVLELARAQQRERRLQVQADRDRIARDLHDHVVQRIFATGLALDRISRSLAGGAPGGWPRASANGSTSSTAPSPRIRSSIFELQQAEDASPVAVRRRIGRGRPVGDRGRTTLRADAADPRRGRGPAAASSCRTSSPWCGSW